MLRNKVVTARQLQQELLKRTLRVSQSELARTLKIKPPLISNVINGKVLPCGRLLKWLGYRRVVVYQKL